MNQPGAGPGWARLAQAVAAEIPPGSVDGVWCFTPIRREGREWGTAMLSRVEGPRRRIYTARYMLQVKGKERGAFEAAIQEVGSGPVEALAQLLQEARRRMDEAEPPSPVPPEQWFAPADDAHPR